MLDISVDHLQQQSEAPGRKTHSEATTCSHMMNIEPTNGHWLLRPPLPLTVNKVHDNDKDCTVLQAVLIGEAAIISESICSLLSAFCRSLTCSSDFKNKTGWNFQWSSCYFLETERNLILFFFFPVLSGALLPGNINIMDFFSQEVVWIVGGFSRSPGHFGGRIDSVYWINGHES